MQPLSRSEIYKIVSRVFWDMDLSIAEINRLLEGCAEDNLQQTFYRKLLVSCDWYTLIKIMPMEKVYSMLNDQVLDNLYPKELQERFKYARAVLSKKSLSSSR